MVTHGGETSLRSRRLGIWTLRLLFGLGLIASFYYLSWWFSDDRLQSPWLLAALLLSTAYVGIQLVGNWTLYLSARERPVAPLPPEGLTVDVYVTVCNEPHDLIQRTLSAAIAMRSEHHTWLLDDGSDPELERMAARLGAGYLTRSNRRDAKAGNVNAALTATNGDIVVIFDVDHSPAPQFLERTLGYFRDPRVGFVQVMLTFNNSNQSWVARAASESSTDFYNPTSIGSDGAGSATLVGSNALIRRKALTSIGGYRPGLAEDLATSIALHAAGWSSAYVAEPLAPGLSPPDLHAWFTQQFKWARGVFELLLTAYPFHFVHLTWGQRLSYAVRMTYYWVGAQVTTHAVVTLYALLSGNPQNRIGLQQYVLHLLPLVIVALLIRLWAIRIWKHPSVLSGLQWRAVTLVYATGPVYMLAWIMAIFRVPVSYRPTPKSISGGINPLWLLPQGFLLGSLTLSGIFARIEWYEPSALLLLLFILAQALPMLMLFFRLLTWTTYLPGRSNRVDHA